MRRTGQVAATANVVDGPAITRRVRGAGGVPCDDAFAELQRVLFGHSSITDCPWFTVDRSPVLGLCGPPAGCFCCQLGSSIADSSAEKQTASSTGKDFSAARPWISSILHPSGFFGVPEVLNLTPFPASKSDVRGVCSCLAPAIPVVRGTPPRKCRQRGRQRQHWPGFADKVNASSRYAGCDTLGHSPRRKNGKDSRRNRHTAW